MALESNKINREEYAIRINGRDVPTVGFVLGQLGHQGCRIDRIKALAIAALLLSAVNLIGLIWLGITIPR